MISNDSSTVRSVCRALSILKCFSVVRTDMTLGEISEAVQLPKSTVHRTLSSLEQENFIEQDEVTGKYRLSYELMRLGVVASEGLDIRKTALPEMERLSLCTQQTSNLYIIRNRKRLCIEQVAGPQYTSRHSYVGATHPLYCGSSGRVLLAYMSDEWLNAYFADLQFEKLTDRTPTCVEDVWQSIHEVRRDGFAVTSGEREAYSASVSVPILDYSNKLLAAITVTGPIGTFTFENVQCYRKALLTAAQQISSRYGHEQRAQSRI